MQRITINGRTYAEGDSLTLNHNAPSICYAPNGLQVVIKKIRSDESIGLYSPNRRIDEWHDLEGRVGNCRGYWVQLPQLTRCVSLGDTKYVVINDLVSRGVELKGLRCQILTMLESGSLFVEFDEHVNGCSADGHGKSGHCVSLEQKDLKQVAVTKKEDKKTKKLSKAARKLKVAAAVAAAKKSD